MTMPSTSSRASCSSGENASSRLLLLTEDSNLYRFDRAKEYGNDMVYECASAWYEYANALLIKEEDAPSDNLLTNTEKPAEPAGDENDEVLNSPSLYARP